MRLQLAHDGRRGVSTYIETFTLIGIALGGTVIIYSAMNWYAASAGGPSVAVSGAVLSQGPYAALEKIPLTDTGTTSFISFTIITAGISPSPSYCVTLTNDAGGALGFSTPPASCGSGTTTDPSSVTVTPASAISPGQFVVLSVVIFSSGEFSVGTGYTITVTTSGGAQQTIAATAVPG
jgi:hypothetical protein